MHGCGMDRGNFCLNAMTGNKILFALNINYKHYRIQISHSSEVKYILFPEVYKI